ncbi:hypothetical protein M2475_000838 [Breznakia sp. PF5-3]|uniref:hypothetical protein n=1 Tax=unclassified Breznakia TaxID=2623764 RepID=UPI0024049145|nr:MULTISPECIES: hypothetical protein [unclassified Breznakia]MDF9824444.1 hypothetical protein [Breznakia sp. PM6-1]MDF9835273.1 hypothetical protein [Breznakia sp. PF5-3]MDF9837399.1 hypothetical protein [Breznakia sp. PFB2-8]MDF9859334.1 hypothetical protein [Breznakia sp. PH5-24]
MKFSELMWITIIGVLIMIIIAYMDSKYLKQSISRHIESNNPIIGLYSKIFIAIITTAIAIQANSIMEQQNRDSIKETAPLFEISKINNYEDKRYEEVFKLENSKGIASYLNFRRFDRYSFSYQGNSVEHTMLIRNIASDKDDGENEWYYIPEVQKLDENEIVGLFEKYILEKTGEKIIIYHERYYQVDFVDYKNEMFNYYFTYNNQTKLAFIDSESYYNYHGIRQGAPYGGGFVVTNNDDIEKEVEFFVDNMIAYYNSRNYSN